MRADGNVETFQQSATLSRLKHLLLLLSWSAVNQDTADDAVKLCEGSSCKVTGGKRVEHQSHKAPQLSRSSPHLNNDKLEFLYRVTFVT